MPKTKNGTQRERGVAVVYGVRYKHSLTMEITMDGFPSLPLFSFLYFILFYWIYYGLFHVGALRLMFGLNFVHAVFIYLVIVNF